ncbi:PREDICTED: RING-H2 finger protein ATL54-like [Ipomoea nil]|uniref:RING-H2 finger protein ATL54-like n=1 Tax=Ipomoea nil TaxID=35883 RepID=UPI0009016943|nr:PREDICTED: RING-H2 finger protein ATL54-like [Ipomoea nil]
MAEAAFLRRSRKLLGNDEINAPPPPPPLLPIPPIPQIPPVVIHNSFSTLPPPPRPDSERSLILTIALPIFFASTVLSCCLRLMSLRARRRRTTRAAAAAAQPPPQEGGEIYSGLMVDHPIWYIRTAGLHSSVIDAIGVCKYDKEAEAVVGKRAECAVCLNLFQEDDTLRIMPKCNHAFHVSCIDTWLKSHKNCPVCRAVIELVDVKYPAGASPPRLPGTPDNNRGEQGPETENLEPRNNVAKDETDGE